MEQEGSVSVDLIATTVAAVMWMALSIAGFITVHKWNKRFAELYDKIVRDMEEQT